ncbi:hypothetical protein L596_003607 [Steinernema carpocapsae]|uniref:Uncharacterized protein n=1 Tax=Steinernema carpocapsae TaxID=34508 RepID=A0A4U8UX49_STECR|nr:hypothetical protein L596_003607 [Steinernema carpocapsae]
MPARPEPPLELGAVRYASVSIILVICYRLLTTYSPDDEKRSLRLTAPWPKRKHSNPLGSQTKTLSSPNST